MPKPLPHLTFTGGSGQVGLSASWPWEAGSKLSLLCDLVTGQKTSRRKVQESSDFPEFLELWYTARKVNRPQPLREGWFPGGGVEPSCVRVVRAVLPSSGPRVTRRQLPLTWLCPVSHHTTASCSPHTFRSLRRLNEAVLSSPGVPVGLGGLYLGHETDSVP